MKKIACLVGLVGLSSFSFGFLNINLSLPYQSTSLPGSGSVFLTFSGTVDILNPLYDTSNAILEQPGSGSAFLSVALDPTFAAYVASNAPGVDYTGALFTVEVQSTDAVGNYWFNSGGLSGLAEFTVVATGDPGFPDAVDNEMYGVQVVPEPATLAALGIGAAALIRRRRKA